MKRLITLLLFLSTLFHCTAQAMLSVKLHCRECLYTTPPCGSEAYAELYYFDQHVDDEHPTSLGSYEIESVIPPKQKRSNTRAKKSSFVCEDPAKEEFDKVEETSRFGDCRLQNYKETSTQVKKWAYTCTVCSQRIESLSRQYAEWLIKKHKAKHCKKNK